MGACCNGKTFKETDYKFRILPKVEDGVAGGSLECECQTLGRAFCEPPCCTRRLADALELQWSAKTPAQAPVLECQLQYCTAADLLGLWQDISPLDVKVHRSRSKTSGEIHEYHEEIWRGTISKLKIATGYRFRVKARNTVGWGEFSKPELGLTSEAPEAPSSLRVVAREPGRVQVVFDFADEEGCPVSHIEPEFCLRPESGKSNGVLPGESGDGFGNMFDIANWWWQTPEHFEVHVKDPLFEIY